LLVCDNDRLICQLVFGDDVPDCMREIVATASRGHHERERLLRLLGGVDRAVQGERCHTGQQSCFGWHFASSFLLPGRSCA